MALEDSEVGMTMILRLPMTQGHLDGLRSRLRQQPQAQEQAHLGEDSKIRRGGPDSGQAQPLEPLQGILQEGGVDAHSLIRHPKLGLDLEADGSEEVGIVAPGHHLHRGMIAPRARAIQAPGTRALALEGPAGVDPRGLQSNVGYLMRLWLICHSPCMFLYSV